MSTCLPCRLSSTTMSAPADRRSTSKVERPVHRGPQRRRQLLDRDHQHAWVRRLGGEPIQPPVQRPHRLVRAGSQTTGCRAHRRAAPCRMSSTRHAARTSRIVGGPISSQRWRSSPPQALLEPERCAPGLRLWASRWLEPTGRWSRRRARPARVGRARSRRSGGKPRRGRDPIPTPRRCRRRSLRPRRGVAPHEGTGEAPELPADLGGGLAVHESSLLGTRVSPHDPRARSPHLHDLRSQPHP
jgi:hypothetical protein